MTRKSVGLLVIFTGIFTGAVMVLSAPNTAVAHSFDVALSNSFGFGGINATLIMRRWTEDQ